jgi:uncharacterized protein (TIGR00369 family)
MGSPAHVDERETRLWHQAMPFAKTLGIEVLASSRDGVRARLSWSEERCTADGVLHGGAIMSLADSAGAACAFLNLPDAANGTATIDSTTHFLRAVREGYVEAVSRPLHAGRSVIVVETDVLDGEGRLVARVTQSQAVLR